MAQTTKSLNKKIEQKSLSEEGFEIARDAKGRIYLSQIGKPKIKKTKGE